MRNNLITLIVGDRGTGKTTFIKGNQALKVEGLIPRYKKQDSSKKILIINTFDNPVWRDVSTIELSELSRWRAGTVRVIEKNISIIIQSIDASVMNAVVIFEDATPYVKNRLGQDLEYLCIDSKQKNIDLFFVFHYLMATPPDLARIADFIVLFKTNERFSPSLRNKYPNPNIEKVFNEVNMQKGQFAKAETYLK
jgi:hypothetical protein